MSCALYTCFSCHVMWYVQSRADSSVASLTSILAALTSDLSRVDTLVSTASAELRALEAAYARDEGVREQLQQQLRWCEEKLAEDVRVQVQKRTQTAALQAGIREAESKKAEMISGIE